MYPLISLPTVQLKNKPTPLKIRREKKPLFKLQTATVVSKSKQHQNYPRQAIAPQYQINNEKNKENCVSSVTSKQTVERYRE